MFTSISDTFNLSHVLELSLVSVLVLVLLVLRLHVLVLVLSHPLVLALVLVFVLVLIFAQNIFDYYSPFPIPTCQQGKSCGGNYFTFVLATMQGERLT